MNSQKRLFFAVNLSEETKKGIAKLVEKIPKEKWRTVKPENLHITIRFLGHLQREDIAKIEEKACPLKEIDCFEATLNGIGHFKNRIVWLGVGKGTDELNHLSKKLCNALGVREDRFHAHVTLARNRGSAPEETDKLIEELRKQEFSKTVEVKSLDLMESILHKSGPEYKKLFSIQFRPL